MLAGCSSRWTSSTDDPYERRSARCSARPERASDAETYFVTRPFGADGVMIDDGWAVALAGDDGDGIARRQSGQTADAEGQSVLRECDPLTSFE